MTRCRHREVEIVEIGEEIITYEFANGILTEQTREAGGIDQMLHISCLECGRKWRYPRTRLPKWLCSLVTQIDHPLPTEDPSGFLALVRTDGGFFLHLSGDGAKTLCGRDVVTVILPRFGPAKAVYLPMIGESADLCEKCRRAATKVVRAAEGDSNEV
jgi:hypothetical protein